MTNKINLENEIEWKTIERPGYFGKKRDEIFQEYDKRYGKDNWRIAWQWNENFLDFQKACYIYGDAYFLDSFRREEKYKELFTIARDFWDIDLKDVESGLDYTIQKSIGTHIQDISLRWVGFRRGWNCQGKELVQIRSKTEWGRLFSPGRVDFHLPKLIVTPRLNGWWNQDSVEDFYQSNKVLQARI